MVLVCDFGGGGTSDFSPIRFERRSGLAIHQRN
jgi:hypothetical protein